MTRNIAIPFKGKIPVPFASGNSIPWYLSGGIALANCVAAYKPKGAASLAVSYVNLANPGTNNAAPGVAPTFDAATGWTFDGLSQYLVTGIVPSAGYSMIVQFSNAVLNQDRWFAGCYNATGTKGFGIQHFTDSKVYFSYKSTQTAGGDSIAAGNYAQAANKGFVNGSLTVTLADSGSMPTNDIYIGVLHYDTTIASYFSGNVAALAIYNVDISSYVAALSAAMVSP